MDQLEFVSLAGPLTVGIVAASFAAFRSFGLGLAVAGFLVVPRVVQDYAVYPKIVGRGIPLHLLAVMLAILGGAELARPHGSLSCDPGGRRSDEDLSPLPRASGRRGPPQASMESEHRRASMSIVRTHEIHRYKLSVAVACWRYCRVSDVTRDFSGSIPSCWSAGCERRRWPAEAKRSLRRPSERGQGPLHGASHGPVHDARGHGHDAGTNGPDGRHLRS
jgi:hypothetical protein